MRSGAERFPLSLGLVSAVVIVAALGFGGAFALARATRSTTSPAAREAPVREIVVAGTHPVIYRPAVPGTAPALVRPPRSHPAPSPQVQATPRPQVQVTPSPSPSPAPSGPAAPPAGGGGSGGGVSGGGG